MAQIAATAEPPVVDVYSRLKLITQVNVPGSSYDQANSFIAGEGTKIERVRDFPVGVRVTRNGSVVYIPWANVAALYQ